jgi:hypothetical protein
MMSWGQGRDPVRHHYGIVLNCTRQFARDFLLVLVTLERPHGQLFFIPVKQLERGFQMSVNHQWIVYCIS